MIPTFEAEKKDVDGHPREDTKEGEECVKATMREGNEEWEKACIDVAGLSEFAGC